jgi:hypothetical protein
LRDFSIGSKKYKNGKLFNVTFLYFLMPIGKDPKDRLFISFASTSLYTSFDKASDASFYRI